MTLSKDGSKHVTDEKFNTISHLFGAIFFFAAGAFLIVRSSVNSAVWEIVSLAVYILGALMLFVFSTLHHGYSGSEKVNNFLRTMDYISVFLLIGGTVTPLALIFMRNWIGWTIAGAIWALCAVGIVLRATIPNLPKRITNTFYITLGWLSVGIVLPLVNVLPKNAILLLSTGGILYTVGFTIYVLEKPNFKSSSFGFHEIWHIVVLLAAISHWLFFFLYV